MHIFPLTPSHLSHFQTFLCPPFLSPLFLSLCQVSPLILPVQQPPVLCDLQLQPGLEVQQHVVILLVAGDVCVELGQLILQACDHGLEAGKLC